MITVTLDTVKKRRNAREWRPVNRATCGDCEYAGDGEVIAPVLRLFAEKNPQITGLVRVMRGDTPCFADIPLETWLSGKALRGEQPEHLRRKNDTDQSNTD